jgi:hypothetical protein
MLSPVFLVYGAFQAWVLGLFLSSPWFFELLGPMWGFDLLHVPVRPVVCVFVFGSVLSVRGVGVYLDTGTRLPTYRTVNEEIKAKLKICCASKITNRADGRPKRLLLEIFGTVVHILAELCLNKNWGRLR